VGFVPVDREAYHPCESENGDLIGLLYSIESAGEIGFYSSNVAFDNDITHPSWIIYIENLKLFTYKPNYRIIIFDNFKFFLMVYGGKGFYLIVIMNRGM
jgi:hypothetical protein